VAWKAIESDRSAFRVPLRNEVRGARSGRTQMHQGSLHHPSLISDRTDDRGMGETVLVSHREGRMADREIRSVAVVGTGFMGTGIAQVAAMAGCPVVIHDAEPRAVQKALKTVRWSLEKLRARGKYPGSVEETMQRIRPSETLEGIAGCDLIVEAVYESVPVKEALLTKLSGFVAPETVIGSNTSSVPMELLSAKLAMPQRFIGTHFFGPVALMPLVELVMGPDTSEETLAMTRRFMERIGKTSIVVRRPSPGFLVNRIFMAAALEAMNCFLQGVGTPEDIDTGMRLGYGWAAGPFEVMDNAGLDIMAGVFAVMGADVPPRIREMLDQGHLGRKTGQGFYRYGPDGKKLPAGS
jgi:3-hydroxybutyryl-CoA dehydrogenase